MPPTAQPPSRRYGLRRLAPAALLFAAAVLPLPAQQPVTASLLPDAPSSFPLPPAEAPASIAGTVLDIKELAVSGARVTLANLHRPGERILLSDIAGRFSFDDLPPGDYRLTIFAKGLETFLSDEIILRQGEHFELPHIALPLESANATVQVSVTEEQLAEEQVHAEVQQRVLGVIPNFYTSFLWDAAPLHPKQKFELALRSTTDPVTILVAAAVAGGRQINNTYPAYGDGAEGYAKRFGATYADTLVGRFVGGAILPSVFHQDPRYFYHGSGTATHRALYAMGMSIIARGDNGRWQPNYSHILGNLSAGAIANLYHPASDRGVHLTFSTSLIGLAATAGVNLIREFALKPLTSKVPVFENGKEADAR